MIYNLTESELHEYETLQDIVDHFGSTPSDSRMFLIVDPYVQSLYRRVKNLHYKKLGLNFDNL